MLGLQKLKKVEQILIVAVISQLRLSDKNCVLQSN